MATNPSTFSSKKYQNQTDINGNKTSYSYDAENRLTREYVNTGGNVTEYRYEYDDLGNRIGMKYIENENEVYNIEYAYDRNSRLLSEKKTEPVNSGMFNVTEYGYDNNGNMLSKVWYEQNTENDYELHINDVSIDDSVGYEIYTYDGLNELTGFYDSRGNESSYTYLPNHYRMSKTANGMTTYHIWDGENIVAESDGSKIIRSYVRGHQLLTDDERRTYMYDGHGNMVQQVKGSTVENKTRYDAFGNVVENSNGNDTPFGYCGEYTDSESGLVYLRNRYYDTASGRFITEDPVKDGLNWYAYCGGNPVVFWDPLGFYYIREEMHYATDMDPRNRNLVQKTGRYYIAPETTMSSIRSVVLSAIPCGNFLNYAYERGTGVVGGNSAITLNSLMRTSVDEVTGNIITRLDIPYIEDLSKINSGISLFTNVLDKAKIIDMDNIALYFWDNANVSRYSKYPDALEAAMNKSYEFVSVNAKYFFGQTVLGNTPYNIDMMIANSPNPSSKINDLFNLFLKQGATDEKAEAFKDYLNRYDERIDFYQNLYNDYVFSI